MIAEHIFKNFLIIYDRKFQRIVHKDRYEFKKSTIAQVSSQIDNKDVSVNKSIANIMYIFEQPSTDLREDAKKLFVKLKVKNHIQRLGAVYPHEISIKAKSSCEYAKTQKHCLCTPFFCTWLSTLLVLFPTFQLKHLQLEKIA